MRSEGVASSAALSASSSRTPGTSATSQLICHPAMKMLFFADFSAAHTSLKYASPVQNVRT
jgi:hypothetical protein